LQALRPASKPMPDFTGLENAPYFSLVRFKNASLKLPILRACPVCGKDMNGEEGYSRVSAHHLGSGTLCSDCAISQIEELPPTIKVRVPKCRVCGSIRWKGQWIPAPSGEDWKELVNSALYPYLKDSDGYDAEIRSVNEHPSGAKVTFEARVYVGFGLSKKEGGQLEFEYERTICPSCAMASEKNYPYLIQIRGEGRKLEQDELKRLEHMVESMAEKRTNSPLKVDEKEGGLDVQAYSPDFSLMLRRELERKFMVQMTFSQRLLKKERDGRLVYQKISLVRLFKLRLGSSVVLEGSVASVEGADGYDLVMKKKDGDEYRMSLSEAFNLYKSRQLELIKY